MGPRRTRLRMLDVVVAIVCIACIAAPFVAPSFAVERSVHESTGDIDQRVLQSGQISNPIDGTFGTGRSGVVNGTVAWDVYTTYERGMKLLVSTERDPSMRDAQNGLDIGDYREELGSWRVGGSDRRFGFAVLGDMSLARFDKGAKWRGFDGRSPIEVARRLSPIGSVRTTVKLRAEFGSALPANARPTAGLTATGVVNL